VSAQLDEILIRSLIPSVLAILVRRGADFAAAEDAGQDALVEALRVWPADPPLDVAEDLDEAAGALGAEVAHPVLAERVVEPVAAAPADVDRVVDELVDAEPRAGGRHQPQPLAVQPPDVRFRVGTGRVGRGQLTPCVP